MRYTFIVILMLSCLSATDLTGQTVDEMIEKLDNAESSRERYGLLFEITSTLTESSNRNDREQAISYGKRLMSAANEIKNDQYTASAAYVLAQAYFKNRLLGKTESWLKQTVRYAMRSGDADLILRATSERTRIATRKQRYREAVNFNQEALDYFTKEERNSIANLRARLEVEQEELLRQKRLISQQRESLDQTIEVLENQRNNLKTENEILTQENQQRNQLLIERNHDLANHTLALEKAEEERQQIEKRVEKGRKAIKNLSREALEQKALATEAREELAREEIVRQRAELAAERQKTQRNLAYLAMVVLLVLMLSLYARFRSKRKSAAKLAKANQELDMARQQSDELLENILPQQIAHELKETGKARARHFSDATVLFCDFINFTKTAERLGPEALVHELDICFKAFDNIMDKYPRVEKIKTIGDAYMAATGLNDRKTLPNDIIQAALEMQEFLTSEARKRRQLGLPFFEGRIGLHTGPVVAGVVGARKFAYDIWGDTVNVASRMESQSEAGRVNISEDTYRQIQYNFNCIYRGKIQTKGKGYIDMYFVQGPKSQ